MGGRGARVSQASTEGSGVCGPLPWSPLFVPPPVVGDLDGYGISGGPPAFPSSPLSGPTSPLGGRRTDMGRRGARPSLSVSDMSARGTAGAGPSGPCHVVGCLLECSQFGSGLGTPAAAGVCPSQRHELQALRTRRLPGTLSTKRKSDGNGDLSQSPYSRGGAAGPGIMASTRACCLLTLLPEHVARNSPSGKCSG